MDKPAERLPREKQFRVRVPIGAIFYYYIGNESEGKRIQMAKSKLRHNSSRSNEDIAFVKEEAV